MKKRQHALANPAFRSEFQFQLYSALNPESCVMQPAKLYQPKSHRALDENFTGTLPDKLFLYVLMKVNFSLPKTQLMQIAASCTDADVGGGSSFAPGSTRVN
jgi:hypothetical protein